MTDKGRKEIAGLRALPTLHLSHSQITDRALGVLRETDRLHVLWHARPKVLYQVAMIPYQSQVDGPGEADLPLNHFWLRGGQLDLALVGLVARFLLEWIFCVDGCGWIRKGGAEQPQQNREGGCPSRPLTRSSHE